MRRTNTFAGRLRGALKMLNRPEGIPNAELAEALDLVSDKDKRPLYNSLRDLQRTGEVEKVRPGVWRYLGRPDPMEKQRVMWRLVRSFRQSGRAITISDLIELAGVSKNFAEEFLNSLVRRELARRIGPRNLPGSFVLIKDPVAFPFNEAKAEKLHQIRERGKAAMAALDDARRGFDALAGAMRALTEVCDAE